MNNVRLRPAGTRMVAPPVAHTKKKSHISLLLGLAFAASPALVMAQSGEQPTALQEVVVSASGFEQELKDAPASISVITREELETRHYRDLAEALQNVEG